MATMVWRVEEALTPCAHDPALGVVVHHVARGAHRCQCGEHVTPDPLDPTMGLRYVRGKLRLVPRDQLGCHPAPAIKQEKPMPRGIYERKPRTTAAPEGAIDQPATTRPTTCMALGCNEPITQSPTGIRRYCAAHKAAKKAESDRARHARAKGSQPKAESAPTTSEYPLPVDEIDAMLRPLLAVHSQALQHRGDTPDDTPDLDLLAGLAGAVGEVAKSTIAGGWSDLRGELVQVAGMALAWIVVGETRSGGRR